MVASEGYVSLLGPIFWLHVRGLVGHTEEILVSEGANEGDADDDC